jgi:hypothetical protein
MKAGEKLQDPGSGVEVIVVKPPSDEGDLAIVAGEGVTLGKRYGCGSCGAEVLVSKAGDAHLECHGAPLEMAGPKSLPASD